MDFKFLILTVLMAYASECVLSAPVDLPGTINDLPFLHPYQAKKPDKAPIVLGERRCDNIFHGEILPCLLRPELPPFSYSTETAYNVEYKKK